VTIHLPDTKGGLRAYEPRPEPLAVTSGAAFTSRTVFSAAHVVADPYADVSPDSPAAVDWDATLASGSPRRWTPPSAAWAWTGRARPS
jgi:hypothetical protein